MAIKNIKFELIVKLTKYDSNKNDIITLVFEQRYDELGNVLKVNQLISNDINLKFAKLPKSDIIDLGYYRFDKMIIGNDGTSKLTFKGVVERINSGHAKMDNIIKMQTIESNIDEFTLFVEADVEVDDDFEDEEPIKNTEPTEPTVDDDDWDDIDDDWDDWD